jgi:tyrosine-protein kinase Etk/Wzc
MLANNDSKQTTIADIVVDKEPLAEFDSPGEPNILDLLIILISKKYRIIGTAILGGLLAAVLAFLRPPIYTASAIIMPPVQQSSSLTALLGQLGSTSNLASSGVGIKNPTDLYIGILSSRTVSDELISQFGLQKVYGAQKLSDVRKILASATHFDSSKYSLIQISVDDRDPKRAAALANAYVEKLQGQSSRLAVTEASQRRLFFERQVEAEKDHLAKAETALKKTQEQKGIYQVGSQVEAVIRSMAQMRAEISAREVSLQRLKAGATKQNPEVLRQEIELTAMRKQLKNLESSTAKKSTGDPFLPTTMVPSAGLEYTQRLREVKYRESLFEILAKQYELARIDEAKEAPLVQIVDHAIPPDRRSAPSRRLYVIVGVMLGGVLGLIWGLLGYIVQDPKNSQKVSALKQSLWKRQKA